jgi:hypothetical protein
VHFSLSARHKPLALHPTKKNIDMKLLRMCAAMLTVSVLLFSCGKKDKVSAGIVGTWTLSEYGADNNNNNIAEANELESVSSVGVSGTVTFNSNNTFTAVTNFGGASQTETGTYTYSNNTLTTTTNGGSPDVLIVNTLTNNKLIIKDDSSTPADWTVLTK